MGDSSSFSSLFALVDNHLSKSNIQQDPSQPSTSGLGSFRLPPLNVQRGSSDTRFGATPFRLPIPSLSLTEHPVNDALARRLRKMYPGKSKDPAQEDDDDDDDDDSPDESNICMSDCPINDVLAIQLSNMFKAREAREEEERKKQEEQRKIEENLQKLKLEESSCLIDLMPAIQRPGQPRPEDVEILSSGSSMESVAMPDDPDVVVEEPKKPPPHLVTIPTLDITPRPDSPPKPLKTDMSYILKHKIGKCSQFGKVLCARYRPVAAPYFKVYYPHNIKVFDFSTPSPDDIMQERLRKPSFYNQSNNALTVYE